jgi:hypothetical protein
LLRDSFNRRRRGSRCPTSRTVCRSQPRTAGSRGRRGTPAALTRYQTWRGSRTRRRRGDTGEERPTTAEHPSDVDPGRAELGERCAERDDLRDREEHRTADEADRCDDSGDRDDTALHRLRQRPERFHDTGDGLHDPAECPVSGLARLDQVGLERGRQLLHVALEGVHLPRRLRTGEAGVVDLVDPALDPRRALLVEDVRGADRVGAEDRRERRVPLRLRQPAELRLQLPGEAGDADEVPLGVVQLDVVLLQQSGGRLRRRSQLGEHRLERGARVGADQARVRERGEGADGVVDGQPEL